MSDGTIEINGINLWPLVTGNETTGNYKTKEFGSYLFWHRI